jgi:hypothetical protein
VATDNIPVLTKIKELGGGRSVGVIAVQSPLACDAGRGLVWWWWLLRPCKVAGEDRQGKTKHEDNQAISLHPSLPVNPVHSRNLQELRNSFIIKKEKGNDSKRRAG